jgi:hypothetical protein
VLLLDRQDVLFGARGEVGRFGGYFGVGFESARVSTVYAARAWRRKVY